MTDSAENNIFLKIMQFSFDLDWFPPFYFFPLRDQNAIQVLLFWNIQNQKIPFFQLYRLSFLVASKQEFGILWLTLPHNSDALLRYASAEGTPKLHAMGPNLWVKSSQIVWPFSVKFEGEYFGCFRSMHLAASLLKWPPGIYSRAFTILASPAFLRQKDMWCLCPSSCFL